MPFCWWLCLLTSSKTFDKFLKWWWFDEFVRCILYILAFDKVHSNILTSFEWLEQKRKSTMSSLSDVENAISWFLDILFFSCSLAHGSKRWPGHVLHRNFSGWFSQKSHSIKCWAAENFSVISFKYNKNFQFIS